MDEPDADELAWMACEQFPEEEYEEFYDEGGDDASQLESAQPALDNRRQSPVEEAGPKRFLSDANQCSSATQVQSTAKRVKSTHNVTTPPEEVPPYPSSPVHDNTAAKNDAFQSPLEAFQPADNLPFRLASSIAGDCVTVTGPSGERVYAKLNCSGDLDLKSNDRSSKTTKGLLAQPIDQMFEQAEAERAQKMFGDSQTGQLPEPMAGQTGGANEQLWVEKYGPKSFTDLLSDEQTNRQVLRWLKEWDSVVFGHKTDPSTTKEVLVALRQKMIYAEGKGLSKTHKHSYFGKRTLTRDGPFNRSTSWTSKGGSSFEALGSQPVNEVHEKVLLLCGPPGLGKTTLAHIAAKHCGYRIVEINASDDRVAATLQGKILDAVQMKSVTGDSRPNCLIIDEIDGVLGGTEGRSAIKQLVDIITATSKKNRGSEENQAQEGLAKGVTKKSKSAAIQSLTRPIICICNDLYASALRPLRQIARVHMFSRPSTSRVVARLKYICDEEKFKTNIRALATLTEHAESDIRACLNTLQFLKRKRQPLTSVSPEEKLGLLGYVSRGQHEGITFTIAMVCVGSQIFGSKDMTRSVFDIWGEIFQKIDNSSKLQARQLKTGLVNLTQDQLQFHRIYDLIDNYGEHELAIDGIHENLLHTAYQDSSFSKTVECLDTMCDSDIRNKEVHSKQRYFVNGYQSSTLITIRNLIAVPVRPKIEWPKAYQRYKTGVAGKREMMNTWINQMSPSIARSISVSPITLDVLSPLLALLSPPLRPVAVQLYTNSEKETMKQLVDTMIGYGLTYKHSKWEELQADAQESNMQVQGGIRLDPAINSMVTFEGYKPQHRQLSTTLCQMLGHEIELERIRRESHTAIKPGDSVVSGPFFKDRKEISNGKLNDEGSLSKLFKLESKQQEIEVKLQNGVARKGDVQGNAPVPVKDVPAEVKKDTTIQCSRVKSETKTHKATNFFDGWKKQGAHGGHEKKASETLSNQRDLRPLLYKFHEGFTNAIRRPMLMKEFL